MRIPLGVVFFVCAACASAKEDGSKAKPTPAREIASGGATVRGGGIRMDVQVGRPFAQKPTKTAGPKASVAKPGAVVTP